MSRRYTEKEAAELVLSFYKIIDSDKFAEDYYQRCDAVLRVCLHAFENYSPSDGNIVITLFLIANDQETNLIALDEIGAEEVVRVMQLAYNKTDANLRALVQLYTGAHVRSFHQPDQNFLKQFNYDSGNVVYLPIVRKNSA